MLCSPLITVQNHSKQTVNLICFSIDPARANPSSELVPSRSGQIYLRPGKALSVEVSRLDQGQLQQLADLVEIKQQLRPGTLTTTTIVNDPVTRAQRHQAPRLFVQLQTQSLTNIGSLPDYDLIVIDAGLIDTHFGGSFASTHLGPNGTIRSINPNAIILGYHSPADLRPAIFEDLDNPFRDYPIDVAVYEAMPGTDWILKDTEGGSVELYYFPAIDDFSVALNMAEEDYTDTLIDEINNLALNTDALDGMFFDWLGDSVFYLNNESPERHGQLDINNDGIAEGRTESDALWTAGWNSFLDKATAAFGQQRLVLCNLGASARPIFASRIQGGMLEQFMLGPLIGVFSSWTRQMHTYATYTKEVKTPNLGILMCGKDEIGSEIPVPYHQFNRFCLASALLYDGYYCSTVESSPTNGKAYTVTRWFDEYAVNVITGEAARDTRLKGWLGLPLNEAYSASNPTRILYDVLQEDYDSALDDYDGNQLAEDEVWRRDYEHGVVLVNPSTTDTFIINLGVNYRKITGFIDPAFNDGTTLSSVSLAPLSGIILLQG